jgi:nucleoid DNA-binding protein
MTKADLVEKVAEKTGLTRTDVAVAIDSVLDAIKKALEEGNNIEIRGFGTFKVKPRKARKARNPRTGEVVPVPDRNIPVFKPSNEFKNLVMNANPIAEVSTENPSY